MDVHTRSGLQLPIVHIPLFVPRPSELNSGTKTSRRYGDGKRPYFLFVGRLEKLKGLQTVIPLMRNYDRADLVVVGTGSFEGTLRGMAAGNPRVRFLGELGEKDLTPLYLEATALIVPSLCYEGFPQVVVEAFSMKVPVIARNIGALRELVGEDDAGILFDQESDLPGIMEQLRNDPQFRDELGQKAYSRYLEEWTEDRHLEKYFELIDTLDRRRRDSAGAADAEPVRELAT